MPNPPEPIVGGRGRPNRPQRVFVVDHTERLSPSFVRVHLGGPDFDAFFESIAPERMPLTDKYVKILFADPALGLTPPYDLEALRQQHPIESLPKLRTYTVRSIDAASKTIAIDFVIHGEGVASEWAAAAQPGDLLAFSGPGGGYIPNRSADVAHLLIGDASALPAIAATLEALPADATGHALIEVELPSDEIPLTKPDGIDVRWMQRGTNCGDALVAALQSLPKPHGELQVFAHGERGAMKSLRAVLQDDWGLDRRDLSLSAYWALGRREDAFQAEKRTEIGQIFAD